MCDLAGGSAGPGRVTWQQFRHIHSSLLNDLNVPVKIAQEQLGHASISTTLNTYTHVVDASHRTAVEALEARLFAVLHPNGPKLATASEDARRRQVLRILKVRIGGAARI
jgi:Phage integrase family